jgi:hypothetical protein
MVPPVTEFRRNRIGGRAWPALENPGPGLAHALEDEIERLSPSGVEPSGEWRTVKVRLTRLQAARVLDLVRRELGL